MKRVELLVFIFGLAVFSAGLYMAWPPLGPIGCGLVLMIVSVWENRTEPET